MMKFCVVLMVLIVSQDIIVEGTDDATVALDGSGNYKSISDAVNAAPNYSKTRYNIRIKAGVYNEYVYISEEKQNLAFIGDGADVTIINGDRSERDGYPMANCATVFINGNLFTAKYITFNNSAGPGNNEDTGPATAVRNAGGFSAFYMCNFNSYQDTLFVEKGYQFFRECNISGTVDFIYGSAAVVFQKCNILVHDRVLSVITAQSQGEKNTKKSGFSFHQCNVRGASDLVTNSRSTFLGRPWSDKSTVVFMESFIDKIVDPRGWLPWPGQPQGLKTFYGEYKNYGDGANTAQRVSWATPRDLSGSEAKKFTVRNFIFGNRWLGGTGIPFDSDLGS